MRIEPARIGFAAIALARGLLAGIALTLSASLAAAPLLENGAAADVTEDGLHRVATSLMESAWVLPELNLLPYRTVFVRRTGVSFRTAGKMDGQANRQNAPADVAVPDELKVVLRAEFEQAFRDEFSRIGGHPASAMPGRRTVMAQGFLIDVSTTLLPDGAGAEFIQNLSWEATIVLELRDSMSDTVLARTVERERIEDVVDSEFVREQLRELAQRWARLLHTRFDELLSIAG